MANKTFTATSVAAIKAPRYGRVERYDSAVPGFGVRVTAAGAKSWIFVYSHHGRRRRYTIGPVAVLPLADARATAVKLRDRV
ncbi:MAG: Arm DNA-binding domain-containing protein, partial [Alphaproteobacteria bacterium]